MSFLLSRLDGKVGSTIETAVVAHHERRLRRVGWGQALDPPDDGLWTAGDPPPRDGNDVRVLVDGAQALPAVERAIRQAKQSVTIAGWNLSPHFALSRDGEVATVRTLLAEAAERMPVRVLLWAGAPAPVFRPWRRDVNAATRGLTQGTSIQCAADSHERPLHSHHEKIVLVDDEVAFVGGIDLTDFRGDRFDSPQHPPRGSMGWHDVATELRGPVVADVSHYLRKRWAQVTREILPAPPTPLPAGDFTVQFVATIPERIYSTLPRGSFRILEAYVRALRSARRFVYLENQFLWAPEVVSVLAEKIAHPPSDHFRLVVLLPARPNSGGEDTLGELAALAEADDGHGRFLACSIYSHDTDVFEPIYVHAKVGIVDDRWLTVGSCNLNDHSLFNDTEANVVVCDERLARETRLRLWAEHLEMQTEELQDEPGAIVDRFWKPLAAEQEQRYRAGQALTHRLVRLPHVSKHSERLLGPLQGFNIDG